MTDLVVDGNVASSTQNQAFYGIQFFFNSVLEKQIGDVDALRSNKPKLRPTVMSTNEVRQVLGKLTGRYAVIARLLYGSGIRISEALRLKVKGTLFGANHKLDAIPLSLTPHVIPRLLPRLNLWVSRNVYPVVMSFV